jgi:hypothetical protein
MKKLSFTDTELIILIIIVFDAFLKSILTIFANYRYLLPLGNYKFNTLNYITAKLDDVTNFLFIVITLYLLLVKKVRSPIYLFVCFMLIFKAFMHYLVNFNIYKKLGLNPQEQKKLITFKFYETGVTSIVIFLTTLAILYNIF